MYAQAISQIGAGVSSHIAAKKTNKYNKRLQEYNNLQVLVGARHAQEVNAENSRAALDASVERSLEIETNSRVSLASAEVMAAATGTTGHSVDAVMGDIRRNAAKAQMNRENALVTQMRQFQENADGIDANAASNMQHNVFNGPNGFASALQIGTSIYQTGVDEKVWGQPKPKEVTVKKEK
jgi:hypothetical protein